MSGMVPGLHPNTRPQRKGEGGAWKVAADNAFEARDAPPRWVALGLVGTLAVLLLSVAGVLWFVGANKPRVPLLADAAKARFHTAGPPLEAAPQADRAALERVHPAPNGSALDAAMGAVVQQGWGEADAPPSRADTAMKRAEARQ
uniref:hypothetical protein n=1 Tax=Altererythrobacter segetis TaxID=1104773 RepID=UPI0014075A06|nr:hypothetical protein [Altererythrobacter segetis]